MTTSDEPATEGRSAGFRLARVSLVLLAMIIVAAVATGFAAGHFQHSEATWSPLIVGVLGIALLAIGALAIPLIRDIRALRTGIAQLPKRERASVIMLAIAIGAGGISGLAIGLSSVVNDWFTAGNATMPVAIAIPFAILLVTLAPYLTWRWWRAIDEHEQAAYAEGANIAGHFALSAGIAWWILSRAGLVPDPDVMVLVIAMSFVWSGVWLYRKYS